MKTLKPGDRGLRVLLLQRRIAGREGVRVRQKPSGAWEIVRDAKDEAQAWKIDPGKADGVYGPQTQRAVASFELMHGLPPDGRAGKAILRRLRVGQAVKRVRRRIRARKVKVHSRAEWNAAPARGAIGGVAEPCRRVFLHCTVTSAPGPNATLAEEAEHMLTLQRIAFERDFFDISYSFVVMASGRVWEGRGWDKAGAHTEGFNSTAYAFAVATRCAGEEVPAAVIESMGKLGGEGVKDRSFASDVEAWGHRQVAAKSCPGDSVFNRRAEVQRIARSAA